MPERSTFALQPSADELPTQLFAFNTEVRRNICKDFGEGANAQLLMGWDCGVMLGVFKL